MTDASIWQLVVIAVFALVVVGLFGYYLVHRFRARRDRLVAELGMAPELVADRAFNAIHRGRSEADVLRRQGYDVTRATELLDRAESARERRDFDTAVDLAGSAHEQLVRQQRGDASPAASPDPVRNRPGGTDGGPASTPLTPLVPDLATTAASDDPEAPPPRRALPKHKAESRFELGILGDELARLEADHADDPAVVEATSLRGRAQAAYDAGTYTDALTLALRGRRRLGSRVETLPLTGPAKTTAAPAPDADDEAPLACTSCGEPLRGNDRFCRFCGTLRSTGRCPTCGAPMTESDRFCGSCGRPFPTAGASA